MTEEPTDPWAWWKAALANPKAIGKTLKMTTTPEQGFYRRRFKKDGEWVPVAIWFDGEWSAMVGVEPNRNVADAHEQWEHCCGRPISLEEYERVAENGEEWSDSDPTVAASKKKPPRPGGIGDNSGDVDEAEQLRDQIESAKKGAAAYKTIKDDETAAKAQSLRSRLLELGREADKAFRAEKDPLVKQGKAVDDRWRFRSEAQTIADNIRDSLTAHENRKLQERRKAEAEAEKARLAEEARRRDEETQRAAAEASDDAGKAPDPAPPVEPAPAPTAPVQATIKGSYGRAASVSSVWAVAEVTDQDALYHYMRNHADVKALLFDLAKRAHKAGHTGIPGIRLEEQANVK